MDSRKVTRAFLLLANYALHRISFVSPNPPPPAEEQAKYEYNKSRSERTWLFLVGAAHLVRPE